MKKPSDATPVADKVKEISGLFFVLTALFVFVSLVTYDPADISSVVYPANDPVANKGGTIGAHFAHFLYHNFGLASFAIVFLAGLWSVMAFIRRNIPAFYLKVIAAMITICSLATLMSMQPIFSMQTFGLEPSSPGAGGIYGKALEIFLTTHLGAVGAWLCVILCLGISVVLATDWLIYVGVLKTIAFFKGVIDAVARRLAKKPTPADPRLPALKPNASIDERFTSIREAKISDVPARPTTPAVVPTPAPATPHMEAPPSVTPPPVQQPAPRAVERPAEKEKPKTDSGTFAHPPLTIFEDKIERIHNQNEKDVKERMIVIESTLKNFDIDARVVNYEAGPTITLYEIELAPGTRYSKIVGLTNDLAIALKAPNVRVVAPMPGRATVGIEVPNPYPDIVRVKEFLAGGFADLRKQALPLLLGKTNGGEPIVKNLAEMPHLLVAGTTGSGKSVCLNAIITSLACTLSPQELKMIMIDPKMVELSAFKDIPHLWSPVVTDMKKAPCILDWLVKEMEERYTFLSLAGVKKIDGYNQLGERKLLERVAKNGEVPENLPTHLPYIVLVIDELADMMMMSAKEVERSVTRIAQKSRAVGIHLVVATQRPSVDVITGLIKANMPARIAFKVSSKIDSRTILDQNGAECLLGKGDMLMLLPGLYTPLRAQCTYVSDKEIRDIVGYLHGLGTPEYHTELVEIDKEIDFEGTEQDELFDEAVRIVLESQRGSISLLQRHMNVGYGRAARLIDNMAKIGIVGEYNGSSARAVTMTLEQWEAAKTQSANR